MNKKISLITSQANKNLSIAEHLIKCYLSSRDGLKELGILRSERNLQGDYAEWLVANMLNLRLADTTIEKGIDGWDKEDKSYQIKSRVVENLNKNTSFDIQNIQYRFDYLIAVFFDFSFDVLGILKIPYEIVTELGRQTQSTFRFRWNNNICRNQRIEKIYWADE